MYDWGMGQREDKQHTKYTCYAQNKKSHINSFKHYNGFNHIDYLGALGNYCVEDCQKIQFNR